MTTLTYTAARADLAATIDKVVRDRTTVIIRKKKDAVVMMNLEDYEAWAETVYLLRSPKNAKLFNNDIVAEQSTKSLLPIYRQSDLFL